MADPARSPTAKSEAVYRTTFYTISAILGEDTALSDVGRDACRDLLTVLKRLPPNAKKRFPTLSPREAAEHAATLGIPAMSMGNVNEYMNKLSTLFNFGLREGWVNRNPARGLKVASSSIKGDRRRPFAPQQLISIFNAPLYRGCRDDEHGYAIRGDARPRRARFWVPLIGLYSGLRLNEICQMHTADLRQVDQVWCFDVRADPTDNKSLKTSASQRLVPVHPVLEHIGLLAYHRDRQKAGDLRLFPEIETDAFGLHSGRVSRWFTRFLVTCDAAAAKTCFHSFRHSFRDALREAGVEREIALRLGGWTDSGLGANAVGDGYGRGFSASRLHTAVSLIEFPSLDLTHLVEHPPRHSA
jgi:integrase